MGDEKFDLHQLALSLIVGFVAAATGALLVYGVGFSVALSSAILWFFFGFIAVEYGKDIRRRKKERNEFLKRVDENIDKRMENICQHTAFYTKNGLFEGIIRPLSNEHFGKVKWVISKFVSKKISTEFSYPEASNEIVLKNINSQEYSEFTMDLYPESENCIFLTSPFTPEEWFKILLDKSNFIMVKNGEPLPYEDFPPHMKSLLASSVDRKRLVIVADDKWEASFRSSPENRNLLNEFCRINGKEIQLRFIKESELKKEIPQLKDYAFATTDIAIYDRKVLLVWKKNTEKIGDLHLKFPPTERLLNLFNFKDITFYHTQRSIIHDMNESTHEK